MNILSPAAASTLRPPLGFYKGAVMAGYMPMFSGPSMYRPLVTPPKGSSRTIQQPVMPGAQTPTVSAIPQMGGGVMNVQQSEVAPSMPYTAGGGYPPPAVYNPFSVGPLSANDPRVLYGQLSRSKQTDDFTGGGTSMYGGGRVIGPPGGMSLTPQDQQAVAQDRMYGAAAGSGPYDSPSAAGRFNSLQSPVPHTENTPPVGRTYGGGSRVVRMPDGRTVLVGPGVIKDAERGLQGTLSPEKQDEVLAQEYERTPAGRAAMMGNAYRDTDNGPIGGYVPGQLEKRDAHVQKQRDKKAMLQERRQNRAIDKYDLPIGKTYNAPGNVDPRSQQNVSAADSTTPGYTPGAAVTGTQQERDVAFQQSVASLPPDITVKYGLKPESARMGDVVAVYRKAAGNLSTEDKQKFRSYVENRARRDEQFRKEFDAMAAETEWRGDPSLRDNDSFKSMNEFRVSMGMKPLKWVDQPAPRRPPIPTGPPGMVGGGFGTVN